MTPWEAPTGPAPVHGRLVVPGSKSASARSLVLSALATTPSILTGVLDSRDTSLMRNGLSQLGAGFTDLPDGRLEVVPAASIAGGAQIDCGLAGTVLRFLPAVAALAAAPTRFFGDAAAADRPVAPLLAALGELGATISEPPRLPFEVAGSAVLAGGPVRLDASASSQFVSALLLAAPRFAAGVSINLVGRVPSLPHLQMTSALLQRRGVAVNNPEPDRWQVLPGPIAGLDEVVEPDLTNAATLLAAALVTGGELTTAWPEGSVQAADQLLDVLRAFGAEIEFSHPVSGREVTIRGTGRIRPVDLDLHQVSELTPAAAALAALAEGPSRLSGVAHIRGHETDRLAALAQGLSGLGVKAAETSDGLAIEPGSRHGGLFPTHADHRLAHAAALLGLVTPGVRLDDVSCTTKTLPDFPGLWLKLIGADQ